MDRSRKVRIEAIKRFPRLVELMNAEAQAAVAAIEAKHPGEQSFQSTPGIGRGVVRELR